MGMANRYVVIMAGGRGERFWPESRLARPKQLLPIVGDKAMLSQTVERLKGLVPVSSVFVITNAEQRPAVLEVCPELDPDKVIGEPVGRDTTAAVGLATILVQREDPEAVFAMLPADAVIQDQAGFRKTLETAFAAAASEPVLATIGIAARYPATGYGYIERGELLGSYGGGAVYKVRRFVEKPDKETAETYLQAGGFFWNAGMFIWSVPVIRAELERSAPEHWRTLGRIDQGLAEGIALDELLARHYPEMEKISIDYAVIEKAGRVVMVASCFDWDDVGEWSALERHYEADASGNVIRGTAVLEDASRNIVYSRDPGHCVALLGVDDLVVVRTADATLVCHKDQAQAVKKLVQKVGAEEALKHLA